MPNDDARTAPPRAAAPRSSAAAGTPSAHGAPPADDAAPAPPSTDGQAANRPPPGYRGSEEGRTTARPEAPDAATDRPVEVGGQAGPEPTRYGDWEKNGRCTDF